MGAGASGCGAAPRTSGADGRDADTRALAALFDACGGVLWTDDEPWPLMPNTQRDVDAGGVYSGVDAVDGTWQGVGLGAEGADDGRVVWLDRCECSPPSLRF